MPACAICGSRQAQQIDGAAEEGRPLSGRVLPVITSIIVVLPAPLGPMMQRSSPASMVSVSAFSALKPSKLTRDVFEVQHHACVTSGSPASERP